MDLHYGMRFFRKIKAAGGIAVEYLDHEAVVCVKKKEYFSKEEVPLPLEKTKHIIRKCSEEEM